MKQKLTLSRACWDELSSANKADVTERYDVKVAQHSYAPADDLDQLREMAPVARMEVAHG